MKKIILKVILLNLLFLASCSEDYVDYNAPDQVSDFTWVVGLDQNKSRENALKININTHLSFIDLSLGYQEHKWEIEEHNRFLKAGFKNQDSLKPYILNDNTVITDAKAHVLFQKPGINTVHLYNTYNQAVSRKTSLGTLTSKEVDGVHVIDTIFEVDVYGHIKPTFKIHTNSGDGSGEELINVATDNTVTVNETIAGDIFEVPSTEVSLDDKSTWPTIEVNVAGSLIYEDFTHIEALGRSNNRRWINENSNPSTSNGEKQIIKFFRLGTFEAGTITANRVNNATEIPPTAEAIASIPLMIKVIASNENPLVVNGQIRETQDEKLRIQLTGEVENLTDKEGFFTVNVTNGAFAQQIPVKKITIDADNPTFIELALTAPIYSSDNITVDYAGGNIQSVDGRTLADFSQPVVSFLGASILTTNSWSGYEEGNTSHAHGYVGVVAGPNSHFWVGGPQNGDAGNPLWSRSTIYKFRGDGSLKFNVEGGFPRGNLQMHQYGLGLVDKVPAGTYEISYMVYKEAGCELDQFQTWAAVSALSGAWDLSGVATETWTKVTRQVVLTAPIEAKSKFTLVFPRGTNPNAQSGKHTMYFDEFSMIPLEVRP